MSVDCEIRLASDARLNDVTKVMGLLAGLPLSESEGQSGHKFIQVEGAKAVTSSIPEMALIHLSGEMVDRERGHQAYYHFEGERFVDDEHRSLCRQISVRSTPFWLAVARGLVDFFGGSVDYADCDNSENDYTKKQQPHINAVDGDAWQKLQDKIRAVRPVTKEQMREMQKHAAYKP